MGIPSGYGKTLRQIVLELPESELDHFAETQAEQMARSSEIEKIPVDRTRIKENLLAEYRSWRAGESGDPGVA